MKGQKQIAVGLSIAALLVAVSVPGFSHVWAQTTTEDTTTVQEEPKTTIQERLAKRKEAMTAKLTAAQQARLKGRCRAAQAKLGTINDRALEVKANRLKAYANLDKHLNALVAKVGDKADTTELQAEIKVLAEKVDVVEQALEDYHQAVSDLKEMDCVADPDGFKASLEEARSLQAKLKEASIDIHNYIKDTIKPTLKALRAALAKQKESAEN